MLKLNQQRGYRSFVNQRDEALEVLLRNSRLRISELTGLAFTRILELIQSKYEHIMQTSSRVDMDRLDQSMTHTLEHLSFQIWMEMIDLRRKAYMLSYAGESQAIATVTGTPPKNILPKSRLDELALTDKLGNGISPMKSFNLRFNKLRRDIISKLEYSLAFGEPANKALGRVWYVLPRTKALPKKKVLKTVTLTEAGRQADATVFTPTSKKAFSFEWDAETWTNLIGDVKEDYEFTDRSPEKYLDIQNPWNDLPIRSKIAEEDKIYEWEVENEVVNDFVEQVRKGQVESAKKHGITDFVWIAILDDRTDDCCDWRNGLLSSEIDARLKTDKSGDHCRALVPPAHFNCRCTLAPAGKDLEAVDNSDIESEFDEWLNQS